MFLFNFIVALIAMPFVMKPKNRGFLPFLFYFGICLGCTPFLGIPLCLYFGGRR